MSEGDQPEVPTADARQVLIVDDNDDNLLIFTKIFEQAGAVVIAESNPERGVE